MTPAEVRKLLPYLTEAEREELDGLLIDDLREVPWRPLPGPQTMAAESPADVVGFGGAAGGGKTDLAIGLALTEHRHTQIFRREGPQLTGIVDRLKQLVPANGVRGNPPYYEDEGRKIELNSMPNPGDETKYQGRPKDLLVIDEAANFLESQVRFVKGWVRTTIPGQRCRTLMTFNPPTTQEGRWVIAFFGPWLDKSNPLYPTAPGQLRWCYVDPVTQRDVWLENNDARPFVLTADGQRVYEFDPADHPVEDIVRPESRTFIPSKISDNPFLVSTGYIATLQAMPEPLRSQMLYGDFEAGIGEDPWQVCPTAWVEAAMARWTERSPKGEMLSVGVDVARGGKDDTVIACRYEGMWFDRPVVIPGKDTPDGQTTAALVLHHRRNAAPIHIDVIGVGASPYDQLRQALGDTYHLVIGVNSSARATATDISGKLQFRNMRSQLWWKMREALDPANDTGIALPPDDRLRRELCAPKWSLKGAALYVESREDIIDRTGQSPDVATGYIMALIDTPKQVVVEATSAQQAVMDYNPFDNM